MQVKLLRVIQQKTVRPIGDAKEYAVDVRILSATHKNLANMVAAGTFREDLFYRINVIEIRVPSLRERDEDIPDLIDSILKRQSKQLGEALHITPAAREALVRYHFPGNVREMENILERAATLCASRTIDFDDLQLRSKTAIPMSAEKPVQHAEEILRKEPLGDALEDIERNAIVKALEQTRYNKTKAAALLGMSFRSLRYRIKKLGLE